MNEYLASLTDMEKFFWYIGVIATLLLVFQFLLTLIGIGDSFELDADFDGEVDSGLGINEIFGIPFNLFTIRGIISFFFIFGWSGLTLSNSKLADIWVIVFAVLLGLLAMFVVALVYGLALKLGDEGTLNFQSAISKKGEVYLLIPAKGQGLGKVELYLNGRVAVLDAKTNGQSIATGETVRVEDVSNGILIVEKI